MDPITQDNQRKWDALVRADVPCSRPYDHVDPDIAKSDLDPDNLYGDLRGKQVLCLASGGGRQTIAFALLGAQVTLVDFSAEQLKKDEFEAKKHGVSVRMIQADMRDLSALETGQFEVVYQPYSINYVPEVQTVFDEVARVLKPGGVYHLMFHNPFVQGSWKDACWGSQWDQAELWQGKGYPISLPYQDGVPIRVADQTWNYEDRQGQAVKLSAPQEFKHTLSTILNSLIRRHFTLLKFEEYTAPAEDSQPGTWAHYVSVAAPWLFVWCRKDAD